LNIVANKIVELRTQPFTSFKNMKDRLTQAFCSADPDISKLKCSALKFDWEGIDLMTLEKGNFDYESDSE